MAGTLHRTTVPPLTSHCSLSFFRDNKLALANTVVMSISLAMLVAALVIHLVHVYKTYRHQWCVHHHQYSVHPQIQQGPIAAHRGHHQHYTHRDRNAHRHVQPRSQCHARRPNLLVAARQGLHLHHCALRPVRVWLEPDLCHAGRAGPPAVSPGATPRHHRAPHAGGACTAAT